MDKQRSESVQIQIEVSLPARDRLHLSLRLSQDGTIDSASLSGVGCTELLDLMVEWRSKLTGRLIDLELPTGTSHSVLLIREAILKAQGRWDFPYKEEELCHCRAVSTAKVDAAIVGGCHTVESVRAATSANTSCGTCLQDLQSVLSYRLGSHSES